MCIWLRDCILVYIVKYSTCTSTTAVQYEYLVGSSTWYGCTFGCTSTAVQLYEYSVRVRYSSDS
eukprot:COSAG01_NODE_56870_length_315_cov_10.296296_1_plen_63_part_01